VDGSLSTARETGAAVFATEEQFADLIGLDNKEIWNGLAGVKPVSKFANRKAATERIWKPIQSLGEKSVAPASEPQLDAQKAEAASAELPVAEPGTQTPKQLGPWKMHASQLRRRRRLQAH
jgi:hypothetical protein